VGRVYDTRSWRRRCLLWSKWNQHGETRTAETETGRVATNFSTALSCGAMIADKKAPTLAGLEKEEGRILTYVVCIAVSA